MKRIALLFVFLLFAYLIPVISSHNIYETRTRCTDCEVWATAACEQDFYPLVRRGFELRSDGNSFRAIKHDPLAGDTKAASVVARKIEGRGGFSTLELTGDRENLPTDVSNTYRERGMECVEFTYRLRCYQMAVRGDKHILGTPAISVGY